MFGFGKSKTARTIELLVSYVFSGQSVMHKFFTGALGVSSDKIRKIELTYFTLSVLTYVILRFYKNSEKEEILDGVSLLVIEKCIQNCEEEISIDQAVDEYQVRYKEYDDFLSPLFSKNGDDPEFVLTMRLYYCVTQENSNPLIAAASPIITQYVLGNIDFVKKEL